MPKLTREKVQRIRDNAERLLNKMYQDGKVDYTGVNTTINNLIKKVEDNSTPQQLVAAIKEMKTELLVAVKESKTDVGPLASSLADVGKVLLSRNDDALIRAVKSIKSGSSVKTKDRTDEVIKAIQGIMVGPTEVEFPDGFNVNNWPVQKIAQPVTNININPLRGFIHTTAQTLTTSRSKVPGYGELSNRRSLIVYNNSSTITIYLGGSGVTSTNGFPLPPSSYSPSIDASPNMVLYGLTNASTANVRVMETSNDNIGG